MWKLENWPIYSCGHYGHWACPQVTSLNPKRPLTSYLRSLFFEVDIDTINEKHEFSLIRNLAISDSHLLDYQFLCPQTFLRVGSAPAKRRDRRASMKLVHFIKRVAKTHWKLLRLENLSKSSALTCLKRNLARLSFQNKKYSVIVKYTNYEPVGMLHIHNENITKNS